MFLQVICVALNLQNQSSHIESVPIRFKLFFSRGKIKILTIFKYFYNINKKN